ncbi:MAG: hypothetical protein OXI38_07495 [Bacteroidota bacterium]|nr:hypothetical protein [Bacteroidota bacterium]
MKSPDLGKRGSEAGRRDIALLKKLAEGGRKMTPADYRAQRRSYALTAATTSEERGMLAKHYDSIHGD